jgi:hypothetical protein
LNDCRAVIVLYFHPWEFDQSQDRLPLGWLGRLRTYIGMTRVADKFKTLLSRHQFVRAIDAAKGLDRQIGLLPFFSFSNENSLSAFEC